MPRPTAIAATPWWRWGAPKKRSRATQGDRAQAGRCHRPLQSRQRPLALGRAEEAVASYDRAIAARPEHAEAYSNRGNALLQLRRVEEALASFDRQSPSGPTIPKPIPNRGNALLQLRRVRRRWRASTGGRAHAGPRRDPWQPRQCLVSAQAGGRRAGELRPGDRPQARLRSSTRQSRRRAARAAAVHGRGRMLRDCARARPAPQARLRRAADCAMKLCDWSWRERHQEDLRFRITEQTSIIPPFLALVHFDDPMFLLQCAENWIKDQIGIPSQPTATGRLGATMDKGGLSFGRFPPSRDSVSHRRARRTPRSRVLRGDRSVSSGPTTRATCAHGWSGRSTSSSMSRKAVTTRWRSSSTALGSTSPST